MRRRRIEATECGTCRSGRMGGEIDEAYVVAGHKGQPAAVAKRGVSDGAAG